MEGDKIVAVPSLAVAIQQVPVVSDLHGERDAAALDFIECLFKKSDCFLLFMKETKLQVLGKLQGIFVRNHRAGEKEKSPVSRQQVCVIVVEVIIGYTFEDGQHCAHDIDIAYIAVREDLVLVQGKNMLDLYLFPAVSVRVPAYSPDDIHGPSVGRHTDINVRVGLFLYSMKEIGECTQNIALSIQYTGSLIRFG